MFANRNGGKKKNKNNGRAKNHGQNIKANLTFAHISIWQFNRSNICILTKSKVQTIREVIKNSHLFCENKEIVVYSKDLKSLRWSTIDERSKINKKEQKLKRKAILCECTDRERQPEWETKVIRMRLDEMRTKIECLMMFTFNVLRHRISGQNMKYSLWSAECNMLSAVYC